MYKCNYCAKEFSHRSGKSRHQKICPHQKDETQSSIGTLMSEMKTFQSSVLQILDAKLGPGTSQPPATGTTVNNITNNINIYFNKDLKYFTELVNVMGHTNAVSYLLYTLPATRNLFDVINKIFVRDGVNCPFSLTEEGEFVISRGEGETEIDPTGALIDLENKNKIKDAVLTAFVDTNKAHHAALQEVRLAQIREPCDHFRNYTAKESAILNSTYETQLEPSRLYEILDLITAVRPKKQDYEGLRRIISKTMPLKSLKSNGNS